MNRSFTDWLGEGEQIYATALDEFRKLEAQIEMIEQQLLTKKAEVNQIALVIGKPPVDGSRRLSAQLIEPEHMAVSQATVVPAGHMARALSGRGIPARV